jgi:hypothetical protein
VSPLDLAPHAFPELTGYDEAETIHVDLPPEDSPRLYEVKFRCHSKYKNVPVMAKSKVESLGKVVEKMGWSKEEAEKNCQRVEAIEDQIIGPSSPSIFFSSADITLYRNGSCGVSQLTARRAR